MSPKNVPKIKTIGAVTLTLSGLYMLDTLLGFLIEFLHMCLQTSPPIPQKPYAKFQNYKTTFKNTPLFPPKKCIVQFLLRNPIFRWRRPSL